MPELDRVTFCLLPVSHKALQSLAAAKKQPVSEVIRSFVERGLQIDGAAQSIDFTRRQIREELEGVLAPKIDRLANIFAKAGVVSAASYFLLAHLLSELISKNRQHEFMEILATSKAEAAVYMKMRDREIDDVLRELKRFETKWMEFEE